MNLFVIFLRIVHVVSAALWVGGAMMFFAFVEPAVRATTPESGKFLQNLMARRKFTTYMQVLGILTIIAGSALLWRDSLGLQSSWFFQGPGVGFSLGAIMGFLAAVSGIFGMAPTAKALTRLGVEVQGSNQAPTPAQAAELSRLDKRLALYSRINIIFLVLAVLCMATARYWSF